MTKLEVAMQGSVLTLESSKKEWKMAGVYFTTS
jgi:hypothetical protein